MRLCRVCGKEVPKKSSMLLCEEHIREYKRRKQAEYTAADPERIKKNRRESMKRMRGLEPEKHRRRGREFYTANRDRISKERQEKRGRPRQPAMSREEYNARKREKYQEQRDYYAKKNREWVQSHPAENRQRARRRYLRTQVEGSFTTDEWETLVELCDGRCLKCGRRLKLTADHIIPLTAEGTTNWLDNIQPLCGGCNSSKRTTAVDYRPAEVRRWAARLADRRRAVAA